MLRLTTLGVALGEVSNEIGEVGGENQGPRISWYLHNCEPPIRTPAPWCAAGLQGCSDIAARALRVPNPLDEVRREALVLSYYEWAKSKGLLVPASEAQPGDLAFFDFHPKSGNPWDHIGLVIEGPGDGVEYRTVEGNTSSANQREGDRWELKTRRTDRGYATAFARWAP